MSQRLSLTRFHGFDVSHARVVDTRGRLLTLHDENSDQVVIIDTQRSHRVDRVGTSLNNPRATTIFRYADDASRIPISWETLILRSDRKQVEYVETGKIESVIQAVANDVSFLEALPPAVIAYTSDDPGRPYIVREDQSLRPRSPSDMLSGATLRELARTPTDPEFISFDLSHSRWRFLQILIFFTILFASSFVLWRKRSRC